MEPIKPGTRCECHDCKAPFHRSRSGQKPCTQDAVRMVTVERQKRDYERESTTPPDSPVFLEVPMCAACADFHEKGVKS